MEIQKCLLMIGIAMAVFAVTSSAVLAQGQDNCINLECSSISSNCVNGNCVIICDGVEQDMVCESNSVSTVCRNGVCMACCGTGSMPVCSECADGTPCGQTNANNFQCTCRDINNDGSNEICILMPSMPDWPDVPRPDTPPIPRTCAQCADGTQCGDTNARNQLCHCIDTNRDGNNEVCFLRINPSNTPPIPTCTQCSDGTPCGQTNANNFQCTCRDINNDGNNEVCQLIMSMPQTPRPQTPPAPRNCLECFDGTLCGDENSEGRECACIDVTGDGNNEVCTLTTIKSPVRRSSHTLSEFLDNIFSWVRTLGMRPNFLLVR